MQRNLSVQTTCMVMCTRVHVGYGIAWDRSWRFIPFTQQASSMAHNHMATMGTESLGYCWQPLEDGEHRGAYVKKVGGWYFIHVTHFDLSLLVHTDVCDSKVLIFPCGRLTPIWWGIAK